MNKVYYLFVAIFFCSLALPVRGQKGLDETIQKNVLLEKDIELLKKDSSKVKDGIKNILIQIKKDSIKNTELEKQYNSLMASVSQDSIIALRQQVDSLESLQKSLQASINSLKKELSEKNSELRNADSELQDMNVYSEIQKQQSYKSNNLYLTQKYSTISLEKLTTLSNSVDEYKSFEGYADYKKRILVALNNKKMFDVAWNCVSNGVGYQDIDDLRSGINTLLEIKRDDYSNGIFKLSAEQYNEMDSLDIKLSRFNSGIKELQSIVTKINTDDEIVQIRKERKSSSKRECIDRMKQYVIPEKGSEVARVYERYFKMIPYLEKLLRDYWDELKANPFNTPTKTETTIIDLVAK